MNPRPKGTLYICKLFSLHLKCRNMAKNKVKFLGKIDIDGKVLIGEFNF